MIPKERYKTHTELVIPLARQAVKILVDATHLSVRHPHLIFPTTHGNLLLREHLVHLQHKFNAGVPHGFRNSLKTWTQEYRMNPDLAETALGHSISTHGGAYGRAILASTRVYLNQDWADYNYGNLPGDYKWSERFEPEQPHTYPDADDLLSRDDIDALKAHLDSDIPGQYFKNIPKWFATIRSGDVNLTHKLSCLFSALTVTTFRQVSKAKVADVDVDTGVWTIPAENNRHQSGEQIRIPLSKAALAVYKQARDEISRGDSGLLFASRAGTPLSQNIPSNVAHELDMDVTPPIFRAAFCEWALASGTLGELVEEALGLTQSKPLISPDESEERKRLEKNWRARVRLMQRWADFLDGKQPMSNGPDLRGRTGG